MLVIGAAALTWVLVASDDPDPSGTPPAASPVSTAVPTTSLTPTEVTTPPTAAVSNVESVVRARYFEFWRTYDAYGAATGPFDPLEFKSLFGPLASGGEYSHLFDYFQTNRLKRLAVRGARSPEEDLRPSITIESDAEVTVTDCAVSSGEVYNVVTGETVGPADLTPSRLVVVMRLVDGVWKVTSVADQGERCAR